jgi:hypothetical protein
MVCGLACWSGLKRHRDNDAPPFHKLQRCVLLTLMFLKLALNPDRHPAQNNRKCPVCPRLGLRLLTECSDKPTLG